MQATNILDMLDFWTTCYLIAYYLSVIFSPIPSQHLGNLSAWLQVCAFSQLGDLIQVNRLCPSCETGR